MIDQNTRFLIVGLGLIGGSYAMGLKKKGYHVDAIDIQEESISYALQNNLIDHGSTYDTALIQQADIIISALYPKAMVTWIKNNQKHMKPHAFISDVSGVKSGIVEEIQNFLRDDLHFCASHPMAGKEVSGVQNADDTIFHSANFYHNSNSQKHAARYFLFKRPCAHLRIFSH